MYMIFEQTGGSGFPWKEIATIIFSAVTALITVYNWQSSRRRVKLKDDLDILRRYREEFAHGETVNATIGDDPSYKFLRAKIQKRMYKVYVQRRTDTSEILTGVANIGIAALALLSTTGVLRIKVPLLWAVGIAVIFLSIGIFFIYTGQKDRNLPRELPETRHRPNTPSGKPS